MLSKQQKEMLRKVRTFPKENADRNKEIT